MAPPVNDEVRIIVLGGPDPTAGKLSFEYDKIYNPPGGRTYTSYLLYPNTRDVAHQRFQFCDVQGDETGFSCRLKMTEGYYKDYWLDSKDGYLQAWSSSDCRWQFVDKGPYYQWRQEVGGTRVVRVLTEEVAPKAFYIRAMNGEPSADDESAQFNVISW